MKFSFISWFTKYSALSHLDDLTYALHFGPQMAELAVRRDLRVIEFEISENAIFMLLLGSTKNAKNFKADFEKFVKSFLEEFYPNLPHNPFTRDSSLEELRNQPYAKLLCLHHLDSDKVRFPGLKRSPTAIEKQIQA